MQWWQAINLTPKRLQMLVNWLDWVKNYKIWEVEYEAPDDGDSSLLFRADEKFIKQQILPEKIEIELGEEEVIFLKSPISKDIINPKKGKEFIIRNLTLRSAKIAIGKIAWHLYCTGEDSISIQAEDYNDLTKGISISLFDEGDVKLLEDLLACGYRVSYESFEWMAYPQKAKP